MAATRIVTGTDVDYGSLTNHLVDHLAASPAFPSTIQTALRDLSREQDGRWRVEVEDVKSGDRRTVTTKFVFIGAGGGALPLLQKSGIPEGQATAAFPSAASGCAATTPRSTNATTPRFTEKPRTDRRPCRCRTSTLG